MNRRVSGFTLVEIIISLAILAIAFFGLISVITYTSRMNAATRERMLAMRAAEKKIEQMLGAGTFDDIYNLYSQQTEGLGWEKVEGLVPVVPSPLPLPPGVLGPAYPSPDGPVLFVRFPLNAGGTGFTEVGTGTFTDNKDSLGNLVDMDLDRNNSNADGNIPIASCRILPVRIEVYWRGIVGPGGGNKGNTYLIYRYTFLRKT
jgi:prepilin-type N-terminal cleavage/methylation domain-containing protein